MLHLHQCQRSSYSLFLTYLLLRFLYSAKTMTPLSKSLRKWLIPISQLHLFLLSFPHLNLLLSSFSSALTSNNSSLSINVKIFSILALIPNVAFQLVGIYSSLPVKSKDVLSRISNTYLAVICTHRALMTIFYHFRVTILSLTIINLFFTFLGVFALIYTTPFYKRVSMAISVCFQGIFFGLMIINTIIYISFRDRPSAYYILTLSILLVCPFSSKVLFVFLRRKTLEIMDEVVHGKIAKINHLLHFNIF